MWAATGFFHHPPPCHHIITGVEYYQSICHTEHCIYYLLISPHWPYSFLRKGLLAVSIYSTTSTVLLVAKTHIVFTMYQALLYSRLVPNCERSISSLYIVTLLI